jgi:hypothetical protein
MVKIITELGTMLAVTSKRNNLRKNTGRIVLQLLVTPNAVLSSLILKTLMMDVLRSSSLTLLTRARRRHIPEDGILHDSYNFQLK